MELLQINILELSTLRFSQTAGCWGCMLPVLEHRAISPGMLPEPVATAVGRLPTEWMVGSDPVVNRSFFPQLETLHLPLSLTGNCYSSSCRKLIFLAELDIDNE